MNRYQEWEDLKMRYEVNDIPFSELVERASAVFFHHDETKFLLRITEDIGNDLNISLPTIRSWRSGQVIPNPGLRKLIISALDVQVNECLNKDAYYVAGQLKAAATLLSDLITQSDQKDLTVRVGGVKLLDSIRNINFDLFSLQATLRR